MVRFKNRYLLVELRFGSAAEGNAALKGATPKSLVGVVRDAIRGLHGDYGLACVQHSLNVKYLNAVTRVAIVRCPRDHHRAVWAAISMVHHLQKVPCTWDVIHIGGTIRSCQKFLIQHNRQKLREMLTTDTQAPVERRKLEKQVTAILSKDTVQLGV